MNKRNKLNTPPIPKFRELVDESWSRDSVAKAIGVSTVAVGQYYNGDTLPSIDKLIKIADFFEVSTDYLLGRTDIRTSDVKIKQICEMTGLSEKTYQTLCEAKFQSNRNWDIASSTYRCFLDMIEEDYYFRICVSVSNAINAIKRINSHRSETRESIAAHIKQQIAKDSNYNGKHDSRLYTEFLDLEEQSIENTRFALWKLETDILTIVKEYIDTYIEESFIEYADFIKECIANGKHNKEG